MRPKDGKIIFGSMRDAERFKLLGAYRTPRIRIGRRLMCEARWLALSSWLWDNGRYDEAVAVRVFWPVIRDDLVGGRTVEGAMEMVRQNAGRLARRARDVWAT